MATDFAITYSNVHCDWVAELIFKEMDDRMITDLNAAGALLTLLS